MQSPRVPAPSAEFERLKSEAKRLAETLEGLLLEREELERVVKPNLDAIYQLRIGQFALENFAIEVECRRLKREIELMQSYLNRSEVPDDDAIALILAQEFAEWEARIRAMSASALKSRLRLENLMSEEESQEIKSLYRALAKKLHPDLNPNQTERERSLWLQVAEAYESGDLDALRSLSLYASLWQEPDVSDDVIETLQTRIERLKAEIEKCAAQLIALKSAPPLSMRHQLADPEWINAEQEKLRERKESLLTQRAYLIAIKESLRRNRQ